jgi:sulfur carrier protein ThiS
MQIEIYIYGYYKNCVPKPFRGQVTRLETEFPITVYQLLMTVLKITTLDAKVLVNGKIVSLSQVINDKDEVRIFSPIAGG